MIAGSITRNELTEFTQNKRTINWFEIIQNLVLSGEMLGTTGDPEASVAAVSLSIPVLLPNGQTVYLKASLTP